VLDCIYLNGSFDPKKDEILEDKNIKEKLPILVDHLVEGMKKFRG